MAKPPAAAPSALPKLNAPMFTDEAKPGASCATDITRIWTGGTMANVAIPHNSTAMAAVLLCLGNYVGIVIIRYILA